MANKRMISMNIVDTDAFLEMPLSAQCLYFHLNMRADDDGFIGNPNKIVRMVNASSDDLKLLIAKSFVLLFDSGVIVIKHWRMHNTLSSIRYKETSFIDEKNQLFLKRNGAYSFNEGEKIDDKKLIEIGCRQVRQTKDASKTNTDIDIDIDLNKEINKNICANEIAQESKSLSNSLSNEMFEEFWKAYPKKKSKDAAQRAFKKLKVDRELLDQMLKAISIQKQSFNWQKDNGQFIPYPSTWLNAGSWKDEQDNVVVKSVEKPQKKVLSIADMERMANGE